MGGMGKRLISSFSAVLLMTVAAVVGIACFPMLRVQYTPSAGGRTLDVSFSYPGASARIIESEVTSKLEGVLSNIRGCSNVSSTSYDDRGSVSLEFRKKTDMAAVRFEAASLIRNLYSSLPDGCSYPSISLNVKGQQSQTAISFSIRSPLPSKDIADYVEKHLIYPLSAVDGVSDVTFYGQTPFEWVVKFDSDLAEAYGISASDISSAFMDYYGESLLGVVSNSGSQMGVRLRNQSSGDMGTIAVKNVNGRIIHLGDIAKFSYKESLPGSYQRVNGLNVLTLSVNVSSDDNLIAVVSDVKSKIEELRKTMPAEIGISVNYDSSKYISDELSKIYFRTFVCLLLLLLFAFLVNRSWRYMVVTAITLFVNLSVAVALYCLFGLHIHIYTLAGVTVSLGIIIDNSIVMIDHYSRYHNRRVFPDLLSAVLTTVAALLVIFLLPEQERTNLIDFSLVIIINLSVSLLVSYLFVPALLDYIPVLYSDFGTRHERKLKRIAKWNYRYGRYISWASSHRWVLILVSIVMFGIPTCLLPTKIQKKEGERKTAIENVLEKIIKWGPYSDNRTIIDKVLGSSFALFNKAMDRSDFYREPARPKLTISAGMPEGCTVHQLNEVMRSMENYLAQVDGIESFVTRINSAQDGSIEVLFKPELENGMIPLQIKSEVISMAINFGGANWRVYGLDESSFNNNIVSNFRNTGIDLSGYNFDRLVDYAEQLVAKIETNKRVSRPEIWGAGYDRPVTEFYLKYDYESLNSLGISPYEYYTALQSPLYDSNLMKIPYRGEYVNVRLESSVKDSLDLWHVENKAAKVGDTKMKLSQVGSITKGKTGIDIQKDNQSYTVSVKFDFLGPSQMTSKFLEQTVDYMNDSVLPLGFNAKTNEYRWFYENKHKYALLIILVILCIFVICSVHFDSLRFPLSIVYMVPLSFVGVFLIFGLTDFTFDNGGFAAFVMLSGITVNAGIYLVSAMRSIGTGDSVHSFLRAFNRKIVPISLTIFSTVIGLVPFLMDGPKEVFWFSFAVGTIAGLIFSVLALLLFLPAFAVRKNSKTISLG